MSEENLETVRRAIGAFVSTQYDPRTLSEDEFLAIFDPEVTYDVSRTNPETQAHHGREGILEILEQWVRTWDEYEIEVLELVDAGGDRVVSVIRERGKLSGSDGWVEHVRGALWTVRKQRIARYEEYEDRAQALGAAGLGE
jgi:ketosteroid isomerase-like protein